MIFFGTTRSKRIVMIGVLVMAAVIFTTESLTSMDAYASEDYWDLKLGGKTVAVFNTEEEANSVIEGVKNAYVKEGGQVLSISCYPEMCAVQTSYRVTERPSIARADEMTAYLLTGTKEPVIYTVKAGDCLWTIAADHGFTLGQLTEMNADKDLSMIYPGDKLNLYRVRPFVLVTSEEIIVSERNIKFETEEKPDPHMYVHTSRVEQEGVCGIEKVTELIRTENGRIIRSEEQSSQVVREPVKKIVLVGTAAKPEAKLASSDAEGRTYSGNGQEIADFALRYEGNPYRYGGTSLTDGADCSGFVMAVYKNFGIDLPRNATSMRGCGRGVSLREAVPGDIICNPGHVGIYVGGGRMINAVNQRLGIAVTSVSYTGSVVAVRRIVE